MKKIRKLKLNDLVSLDASNLEIPTPTGDRIVVLEGPVEGTILQVPVGSAGLVIACHVNKTYTVEFPVGQVVIPSSCLLLLKRKNKNRC